MNTKKIILPSLLALLICSCSHNDNDVVETPVANGKYEVSFKGNLLVQQVNTRASLTSASTVLAYAYLNPADVDASALSPWTSRYTSDNSGNLTAVDAGIFIPSGTYDFFACSPNDLAFSAVNSKMVSGTLSNGIDYLWATSAGAAIATAPLNVVSLNFTHSAAKLHFNIVPDPTAGINSIVVDQTACTVTPTDPAGSFMYLKTGGIDQLKTVSITPATMVADATNATDVEYVMLPLAATSDGVIANTINLQFKVAINGEVTPRIYKYTLTVPATDGYQAKNIYNYKVTVKGNQVVFSACTVTEWTPSDQTATPIVPTE